MWNRLPLPPVEAVHFEAVGDALDPAAVTDALGLAPDSAEPPGPCPPEVAEALAALFGLPIPPDDLLMPGSWVLSTERRVAPGGLEPHLRDVLARLEPRAPAVRALAADATLSLRLHVRFAAAPDGGLPPIEAVRAAPSPWARAALAALGVDIDGVSRMGPSVGGAGWADDSWTDQPWRDR